MTSMTPPIISRSTNTTNVKMILIVAFLVSKVIEFAMMFRLDLCRRFTNSMLIGLMLTMCMMKISILQLL